MSEAVKPAAYWDASALIEASGLPALRIRLIKEKGLTRRHSLAEVFSALTGKPHLRLDANTAASLVENLVQDLEFVELTTQDYLEAAKAAQSLGVRGGGIHDFMHAKAAVKAGAQKFLTMDRNDFVRLLPGVPIEQL